MFLERGWILWLRTRHHGEATNTVVVTFKSSPHVPAIYEGVHGMFSVDLSFVSEQENVSVQSQLFICFLLSFFVLLNKLFIFRIVFEILL